MRWRLALLVACGIAAVTTGSVGARPSAVQLIDCTCYDISRVDTTHKPHLVWGSGGNLWDVSSDRGLVLFSVQVGDLWIANVDGSNPRKLVANDNTTVGSAEFSRDGRWVSFRSDTWGLCVMPAAGGAARDLGVAHARWVSWSPDSTRLVVGVPMTPAAYQGTLAVINADGTGLKTLTAPVEEPAGPSLMARSIWSPSGDRIAYTAGTIAHREVHVLRLADGLDAVIAQGDTPVWSPDGTRLAFMWKDRTLAVVDADGRRLHVLDPRGTDGYGFGVSWSPRGRWIAYHTTDDRGENGADNLMIAYPDGTHRRRLVRGDDNEEIGPVYWSRDGQTILYTHLVQIGE